MRFGAMETNVEAFAGTVAIGAGEAADTPRSNRPSNGTAAPAAAE